MKLSCSLLLYILISLFFNAAHARDYKIEMILFAHKATPTQTTSNHSTINVPSNGLSLAEVESDSKWQPVPKDQYILNDVANNLAVSGKYRVLKHFAWRQPIVDRKNSLPIQINAGRDFTDTFPERTFRTTEFNDQNIVSASRNSSQVKELAGTVTIAIGQYLHLYTDLVYRLPVSMPPELRGAFNRDEQLIDYGIESHRRMRSGELHYIDHPLVGIVIEATPIDDE